MEILSSLYKEYAGREPDRILPLTASGSRRRYYRIGCDTAPSPRTVIGVIGTDRRENMAFMALASHFRSKGINVPEVLAASADGMCYLQEDLGDRSLFDAVSRGRESGNYSPEEKSLLLMTVATLPQIQFLGAEGLDFSVCHPEPAFGERLVIGRYCSLAEGSVFIMGAANHRLSSVTTYPFNVMGGVWRERSTPHIEELPHNGDTVIGSDVWIGRGSVIMPGVHLEDGCIVAAYSVVTRSFPPYSVIGVILPG